MMMLSNQIPNGELVNKAIEWNFKRIVSYMGNSRLLLAPMFLLLPSIRDICDPPSQCLVNPRDPSAKKLWYSHIFMKFVTLSYRSQQLHYCHWTCSKSQSRTDNCSRYRFADDDSNQFWAQVSNFPPVSSASASTPLFLRSESQQECEELVKFSSHKLDREKIQTRNLRLHHNDGLTLIKEINP